MFHVARILCSDELERCGVSSMLRASFTATSFLCRDFFKTWADFACLVCSVFSVVRPQCMLNDTSSRKLGDRASKHQRR